MNGGQDRGEPVESIARYGTVDWLFREYKSSNGYLERVSQRSRPDYERTMLLLADARTKKGDRVGDRSVKAISPVSAESSTGWSSTARTASGSAKARKWSSYAGGRGRWFAGYIPMLSTRTCRIHGRG